MSSATLSSNTSTSNTSTSKTIPELIDFTSSNEFKVDWERKLKPIVLSSKEFSKTLKLLLKCLNSMRPIIDEDCYEINLSVKNENKTHLQIYPTNDQNMFNWSFWDQEFDKVLFSGTSTLQELLENNKSGKELELINCPESLFWYKFTD